MRWTIVSVVFLSLLAPLCSQEPDQPPEPTPEELAALKLRVELETGGHVARVGRLVFSADNQQLISVGLDQTIRYWDVETGELRHTARPPFIINPEARGHGVAVSADGNLLAMVLGPGAPGRRSVTTFNVTHRRVERVLEVKELEKAGIASLAFSPDGKRLALGCDRRVVVCDAVSGKVLQQFENSVGIFVTLDFSPDGKRLAAAWGNNELFVYDLADKGKLTAHPTVNGNNIYHVSWSPGGQILLGTDAGLQIWDTKATKEEETHAVGPTFFALPAAKGGIWMAGELPTGHNRIGLLHAKTGKETDYTMKAINAPSPWTLAVSPDNNWLATAGGPSNAISLWKVTDPRAPVHTMVGRGGPFHAAGWSPDGKAIAWGRSNPTDAKHYFGHRPIRQPVQCFDLEQLARVDDLVDPAKLKRAVLQDAGGAVRPHLHPPLLIHDGEELTLTPYGHRADCATFLADGRLLMSSIRYIQVMDLKTRGTQRVIGSAQDDVCDMAPSADGRFLLTASLDQRLRIYNVATPGKERLILTVFASGQSWIAWTDKGYYAATPGAEMLMGWVMDNGPKKLKSFYPAERFRKALYRPDIIKLVIEKGSFDEAIKAVNVKPLELDKLLPPSAQIELVKIDEKERKATVKVTAQASAGQEIKVLRLLLDGRSFPEGAFSQDNPKKLEFTWENIPIPPGKHELKVLVRGSDTADVSDPIRVATDLPDDQKPVMHVIAIGVNTYKNSSLDLNCPENDARDVLSTLKDSCSGKHNRFREVRGEPILSEMATTENVLKALTDARKLAHPGDLVVFFFAGHGVRETINKTPEFFLLTHEADTKSLDKTALAASKLRDALKELPCQVLLILDACHSAGGLPNFVPITDDVTRSMTDDEAGVTVLAAAMPNETAGEEKGNGRLTRALKSVLPAQGDAFFDRKEGVMHITHLYAKVYDLVQDESKGKQHPMLLAPWTMPPVVLRNVEVK